MFKEGKFHLFKHVRTNAVRSQRQIADVAKVMVVADMVVHV